MCCCGDDGAGTGSGASVAWPAMERGRPDPAARASQLTYEDVLAHLRDEYRGVFGAKQLRRHVDAHLGSEVASEQVALLGRVAPGSAIVVDVGCGYGTFVAAAAAAGIAAVGVDMSSVELAWARSQLPATATAAVGRADARALPLRGGSVDAVTMWNTAEHLDELPRALAEAHRVLRPGGRLIVLAPNYAAFRAEAHYHVPWAPFLRGRLANRWLRLWRRDPTFWNEQVRPCSLRAVSRTLEAIGFDVEPLVPDKLRHPEQIRSARLRVAARLVGRIGLTGAVERLAVIMARNPLRGTILLVAVRS